MASERVRSCLCPERKEEPREMTDYRQGQRSRPKPRLQLFVTGAGKGDVGRKEGQTKKAGLSERKWKRKRGNSPNTHTLIYFFSTTEAGI